MAKGTRYGGASLTAEETMDPATPQPVRVRRAEIGPMARQVKGEESSPGNSSNPSSGNTAKSNVKNDPLLRQPAPTMENPSTLQEEAAGIVLSTDTDGPKTAKRTRARAPRTTAFDDFGDAFE